LLRSSIIVYYYPEERNGRQIISILCKAHTKLPVITVTLV